jgi:hypothetical protein
MLLSSLLMLTFLLSDSGGPAAVDIHDVPIVPALMSTVSLHAVADYTTFASIPAFAVLAVFLLLLFLLLLPFLLLFC